MRTVVGAKKCHRRGKLCVKKCSKYIVLSAKKCIYIMERVVYQDVIRLLENKGTRKFMIIYYGERFLRL